MKNTLDFLMLTILFCSTLFGCAAEEKSTATVTYLPYWEHCEPAVKRLEQVLTTFEYNYTLERLLPQTIPPMGQMANGLIRIETIRTDGENSVGIFRGYLSRCMPTATILLKIDGLDETRVESALRSMPHREKGYFENYFLQLDGDELLIFFNNERVR